MKKLFTSLVALVLVATASADVVKQFDFEDGKLDQWKYWEKGKEGKIVAGNNSSKAIEIRTGSYVEFHAPNAKAKYVLTVDAKQPWGKAPKVAVSGYDPDAKKLVEIGALDMTAEKNFQTVTLKFKVKHSGYHRITFVPGGSMTLDNIKLETK
ncbi:MAG: hypothetical protein SNH28_07920 [Rikenellaceae bacterium]